MLRRQGRDSRGTSGEDSGPTMGETVLVFGQKRKSQSLSTESFESGENKANGPGDCLVTEMLREPPVETVFEITHWLEKSEGNAELQRRGEIYARCFSKAVRRPSWVLVGQLHDEKGREEGSTVSKCRH